MVESRAVEGSTVQFAPERVFGRDGHDGGVRDAQQALGVFRDERAHFVHLVDAVQAIALVDDEEHLLAPFSDVLEKPHLRLRHRAVGGEHEQHQIRARHELLRQTLLPLENDVRPWGVHDVHLAKEIRGDVLGVESVRRLLRARRVAVPKHGDLVRRGEDPLLQVFLPEHRVNHARLTRVEFPDDDQQEEFLETLPRLHQKIDLLQRGRGGGEKRARLVQKRALALQQRERGTVNQTTSER